MLRRLSGVLLHPSSLPGGFGVGDFGPAAHAFLDWLAEHRQSWWQMLPLCPTQAFGGASPYSALSAYAGCRLYISPERLVQDGLLGAEALHGVVLPDPGYVDFDFAFAFKDRVLAAAFEYKGRTTLESPEYAAFARKHGAWLDDWTLFISLKERFGGSPWHEWPAPSRDREPGALEAARRELAERIDLERFVQFLFFSQWETLRERASELGIKLVGDVPIYVNHDSADAWANPHLFKLDAEKKPTVVAGVPPDYFSPKGQRWGNPVYNWERLAQTRFAWWTSRLRHNLALFDLVRIDHFRGFAGYWEVPAEEKDAVNGRWVDAPGQALFAELGKRLTAMPCIAEDLGVITPDVRELKQFCGFPGMRIAQFGFGPDVATSVNAPHNFTVDSVAYTGSHDNNTILGWFSSEADPATKGRFLFAAGTPHDQAEVHKKAVRLVMASAAHAAVFPLQDLFGLGGESRMNTPGQSAGNWSWRALSRDFNPDRTRWFADLTAFFGREA